MSWHPFQPGEAYPVDQIVRVLRDRLNLGLIIAEEAKRDMVKEFEQHLGTDLVWTPFPSWGRSPFNRNAWKRIDGSDFISPPSHARRKYA
jgi:hypothetical protein